MSTTGKFIYYFGDDEAYFKVFQVEFNATYGGMGFTFKRFFETDPKRIQSLYLKAYEDQPALILIDYSKNSNDYLHLARLFTRTINYENFKVIGLLDYLSPPDVIRESILTGVKVNHIKDAEVFDVTFAAMKLISDKDTKEHGFATAKFSDEVEVGILCKIGFVNTEMIHFETDLKLNQNEEIRIKNYWTEQKIMKSEKFFVHQIQNTHIYYNFNYSVNAAFSFIDAPLLTPETSEERKKELTDEYNHDVVKSQRKLKAWIVDNLNRSQPKNVKVLIIDRELSMYKDHKPTDQYEYLIRCQPFFKDVHVEINRQRPNVIAFALEARPEDAPEDAVYNDTKILKRLIDVIKNKFENYLPYIVVFKSGDSTSKDFQQTLGYENMLAFSGDLTTEVLLKMAEVFSKKLKPLSVSSKELTETVYLKKSSPATLGEILTQVTLLSCSETDITFSSKEALPPFSVLHFNFPVDMYITTIPNEKFKDGMYYGLIHGIGEIGKKDLRRYVNSIFFRDLENQKKTDRDEFEKLNQTKLKEIQDEAAKKEAEALALAEQAAAEKEAERLQKEEAKKAQETENKGPNEEEE